MTLMTREEHYDDETSLQECLKYLFSKVKEYNEMGDQYLTMTKRHCKNASSIEK